MLLTSGAAGNIIIWELYAAASVQSCQIITIKDKHSLIAIFDTGLGGLTAVKELRALNPNADYIYFGDTGRVPYGTRSRDTIIKYSLQDMRFLLSNDKNLSAILIACGTVSSTALDVLRANFNLPIFGVVESAAAAAVKKTKNRHIAVIATTATVNSGAYERELKKLDPDITVTVKACPWFVPLVENGFTGGDEVTRMVCERYLRSVRESGADTCILGCRHYPLIADEISQSLPGVELIDTGAEGVKAIIPYCGDSTEETEPRYYVSDDPDSFTRFAAGLFGENLRGSVELIDIERY